MKGLLDKFAVVHVDTQATAVAWQEKGHGYWPQTYFFAPGEDTALPILGNSDTSPHFLHDDDTIAW